MVSFLDTDVAILGAGFSGASLAIQLARRLPAGSRITLVGARSETGRGLAYRDHNPDLLLNVPAGRMGIDPDDSDGFVRWLAERCAEGAASLDIASKFVSRASYGRYISDTLCSTIEQSTRVAVDVVESTVLQMRPVFDGFEILLAEGRRISAAHVVLCLGNAPPRFRLPAGVIEAEALPRMIADPWNDPRMRAIAVDDRVLLVGAGLTMVDQILSLRRAGHSGPITAVSRHGRLPAVHTEAPATPVAMHLPTDRRLLSLFREVVRAGRQAVAAGEDWRSIVDGLRPVTQELWQGLSMTDQRRFLRHVESYWAVHRHRMAPAVAERIAGIRTAAGLDIVAARVVAVRAAGGPLRIAMRRRGSQMVRIHPFDWVVNCTGPGRFPSLAANPVVASLVKAGLARPDRLELGLDVDDKARVISNSGRPSPRLFAVGPLTAGRAWEVTAVREIRAETAALAARLAELVGGMEKPAGARSGPDALARSASASASIYPR